MPKMQKIPNWVSMNTKHVFWQDDFLHMRLASKAKHFEPIEHKFLSNGFKNEWFVLQPFPLKFQSFEIFVWFSFLSSSSNEHVLS